MDLSGRRKTGWMLRAETTVYWQKLLSSHSKHNFIFQVCLALNFGVNGSAVRIVPITLDNYLVCFTLQLMFTTGTLQGIEAFLMISKKLNF